MVDPGRDGQSGNQFSSDQSGGFAILESDAQPRLIT
jgi:hypothetical protein